MNRPGTRFFIGPLTPAQQRKRERARTTYRDAAEIADARYCSLADAFKILRRERVMRPLLYSHYIWNE